MIQAQHASREKMQREMFSMGKISLTLLAIFIVLLLTSCANNFPSDYVYVIDIPHKVCAQYKISDKQKIIFQWVADLPLTQCDGNVSLSKDDWPAVRDWIRKEIANPNCK